MRPTADIAHQPVVLGDVARVLLIEDDDGDALLVEELLRDEGEPFELLRATTIGEALPLLGAVGCVLADLGLPDAIGMTVVEQVRFAAPDLPLVVLTGSNDRERGLVALAAGAQDYLVKGEVDGLALARAVRYAMQRRRAEVDARRLLLAEQRQAENMRLARGLLPKLAVSGRGVETATRYQPGGRDALLGGDFFDALQLADGSVRAVIGDVCGHGPDEAAVGVALRIAWRTLVLSGAAPADVLRGVEEVLRQESDGDGVLFSTACDLTISAPGPDPAVATVRLHGHPAPLLLVPTVRWLADGPPSPPLACVPYAPAEPFDVPLGQRWAMLLTTDGLHEARSGEGRLGLELLADLAGRIHGWADHPDRAMAELLAQVTEINGGDLTDDVALLWLGSTP